VGWYLVQYGVRQLRLGGAEFYLLDSFTQGYYEGITADLPLSILRHGRPGLALLYYLKTHPEKPEAQPTDPKSQPDSDRFYAACAAILAGSGQGSDAPPPQEWPALRRKALNWMSADLRQWDRCVAADPSANRTAAHDDMKRWLADAYLESVREEAALAKLPPDEEAKWRKLWAEVRSLHDRSLPPTVAPPPRELK
jgi:hypothetical protein